MCSRLCPSVADISIAQTKAERAAKLAGFRGEISSEPCLHFLTSKSLLVNSIQRYATLRTPGVNLRSRPCVEPIKSSGPDLCPDFLRGPCPRGTRCPLVHNPPSGRPVPPIGVAPDHLKDLRKDLQTRPARDRDPRGADPRGALGPPKRGPEDVGRTGGQAMQPVSKRARVNDCEIVLVSQQPEARSVLQVLGTPDLRR